MPLDPNIALSYQTPQIESPLNNFAKFATIQHAQNQNALAQFSLAQAQRQDTQNQALNEVYAKYPDFATNPDSLKAATTELAARGAGSGVPILTTAALGAQEKSSLIAQQKAHAAELTASAGKTTFDTQISKMHQAISDIAQYRSPAEVTASVQKHLQAGDIDMQKASSILNSLPQDPAQFVNWKYALLGGTLDAAHQLEMQSHVVNQGNVESIVNTSKYNPLAPPTTVGTYTKAMTPGEQARLPIEQQAADARTSQANTAAAGLPLRAIQADPLGITGAQDAYPLLPNTAAGKTASIAPGAKFTPQEIAAIQADATKNAAPAPAAAPTLGGQLTLRQAAQQGVRGNDFLGAMPTLLAGQVAAIVDHRAPPPLRNTARGDQLMQLVQAVDPSYDATAYGTKAGIEKAFTYGRAGDTVRTFGVVQNHLDTLTQAGDALANGDVQAFNKVGNTIAQWTGQPAPTDFNAIKRIVAGEITKAVIGAAGALGDRNAVDQALNDANSPAQLAGVVNRYKQLISGQVSGYRKQYEAGGGAHADKIFGTTASTAAAATTGVDANNPLLH